MYEGITFEDFLKVGVRKEGGWRGGTPVGPRGGAGWSGRDWHLCGKGSDLGVASKTVETGFTYFY